MLIGVMIGLGCGAYASQDGPAPAWVIPFCAMFAVFGIIVGGLVP